MPGIPIQGILTTGTYMDSMAPGGADNPLVKGYILRYNGANIVFDADIFKGRSTAMSTKTFTNPITAPMLTEDIFGREMRDFGGGKKVVAKEGS